MTERPHEDYDITQSTWRGKGDVFIVDEAIAEVVEDVGLPTEIAHPSHYTYGTREAIDYMRDMGILEEYCVGNVMKYIYRYRHKDDPRGDIEKAIFYLEILRGEL